MRLTTLISAYKSSVTIPDLTLSSYASDGASGATYAYNANDSADSIQFCSLTAVQLSGDGYSRRSYVLGTLNYHAFIEPDYPADALQLRWQDVVKFTINSGTDAFAFIGSIPGDGQNYSNTHGIGWMTDLDGYWRSFVRDTVRWEPPYRTMRSVQHTSIPYNVPQSLGYIIDGRTRTIYWISDGEIVDWYTPVEGVGAFSVQKGLEYRIYVEDADAKLHFNGGGGAYRLALGQADAADTSGAVTTPTITVDDYGSDWVQLSGSAFIHSEGESHLATQWQITLDADTGFTSPVVDSGWVCRDLILYITAGTLEPETDYRARVRYIAEDGVKSDWSDPGTFTTTAEPTEPDTPWSNTGALCEPGEVEPVTPWDKPSC